MASITGEDTVIFGGVEWPLKGNVEGNALAEFEAGIKVGSASYDERTQAFYITMEDFSGGFGFRRMDTRDPKKGNNYWDWDPNNSPDLRRANHITLGPRRRSISGGGIQNNMTVRGPSYPALLMADDGYCIGAGANIIRIVSNLVPTTVLTGTGDKAECESIVGYVEPTGTITNFGFYSSLTGALTGTARYVKSTNNGVTWANGAANYVFEDGFVWDNKILVALGKRMYFGVLTAGAEAWNIDDINDGQPITTMSSGHIHFVGVAIAPWGEPAVYFTNEQRLFVLDFWSRKSYPIETGLAGHFISCSTLWNGMVLVSDGWNVMALDPSKQTITNMGFPRRQGIPVGVSGTSIQYLFTAGGNLHAVVSGAIGGATNWTALYCFYNGGWTQVGQAGNSFSISHMGFETAFKNAFLNTTRTLWTMGSESYNGTTLYIDYWDLPASGSVPAVGTDHFALSGASFITGWIDGGFFDLQGILLKMNIDALHLTSTETVKVEYQLDNDEVTSFQQLVDKDGTPAVFTSIEDTLYFPGLPTLAGLAFRLVRFRITLNRGSDDTLSPEIKALILTYIKKPKFRSTWTLPIDINRMLESGKFKIDGEDCTLAKIWQKLIDFFNQDTLLQFIIPAIDNNPRYMLIQNMPMSFDDFRLSVNGGGRGTLNLKIVEPIVRP